jgi:hypothetical protein
VGAGIVALAACSNQGEGERCELLNGNDDCNGDEGLICYAANQLTNSTSDRCCPLDRARATAPVCLTPVDIVGGDGGTPADTGPVEVPEAGPADAAEEPAPTPGEDAGADAGADAADGSGS